MSSKLLSQLKESLGEGELTYIEANHEVTIEVSVDSLHTTLKKLKDDKKLDFNVLIDVCGVDYSTFGQDEWQTEGATSQGFSRGVDRQTLETPAELAVVYHLLSVTHNWRIRVRVFCEGELPIVTSACDIWPAANWFEREAYDLFGILFEGHDDLRRILTDYGFVGHPFRKSFPLSGHVEMRYDAEAGRVIYEDVDIQPRTLVPKVIRHDSRYSDKESQA